MKKRIVFFGTPMFAIYSLKLLCDEADIVGIVSVERSDVYTWAKINNLNYVDWYDPDLLRKLKDLQADLFVVVAFKILPEEIYNMPRYGSINLHPSLLPRYRGPAPINWAIINGESKTGISVIKLTDKIDSGLILKQKEIPIMPRETAKTLHDNLMKIGGIMLCDVVKNIEKIKGREQEGEVTKAPKLTRENRKIDWNKTVEDIERQVRGLYSSPSAWTEIDEEEVKILEACPTNIPSDTPGKILIKDKNKLLIGTSDYYLEIWKLQLLGKKPITGLDYINGYIKK